MQLSQEPSDWLQIAITLKSKCVACGKDVLPGKALWSKSTKAFRHLTCIAVTTVPESMPNVLEQEEVKQADPFSEVQASIAVEDLLCFICGARTGCTECSLLSNCTTRVESKYCVCDSCAYGNGSLAETYQEYQRAFLRRMGSQNK